MKGDDLLLAHLTLVGEAPEEGDERPTARRRLERELGADLVERLLSALVPARRREDRAAPPRR